jgi:glycosyltransferase involved in cell wall biosynthesis
MSKGDRLIRVVQIINVLGGGAGRGLLDVLPRLDRARFQVEVVCLFKGGPFAAGLRATGIPVRVLALQRKATPTHLWRVWRLLASMRADIAHTQLPESAWIGQPAAWAARTPVRIAHLRNCHRYWRRRIRVLDRIAASFATRAVACSDAVRRFYEEELGYSRVEVLLNPVDTGRFRALPACPEARRMLGLPEDAIILACVAVLKTAKGHLDLLQALTRIRAVAPRVCLLLVGDGAERPILEERVAALGLEAAVRFLGWRSDVPLILAATDLVVMASLHEGLPLAVLEAGAAARPTIATAVDGVREVIEDGVTGRLVPPREPERLAEAVIGTLAEPARMREMGARARARVEEHFAVERIARQWEALYDRLLRERRG